MIMIPSREEAASISTDPSIPGNKYSHRLDSFWFIESTHLTFTEIFSRSICKAMANKYNPHILNWLNYCPSNNLNLVHPSLTDLVTYLAMLAQYLPSMSVKLDMSATQKFFTANLVSPSLFGHPSVTVFSQGLDNLLSCPHKHSLMMSKAE